MHRILTDLGNTGEFLATFACLTFIAVYSAIAPWWRNFVGRSIVFLDICVLGISIPGCLQLMFPRHWEVFWASDWYLGLQVFVVWFIAAIAASRVWGYRNTAHHLHQLRKATDLDSEHPSDS